jgi:hypothetical protein
LQLFNVVGQVAQPTTRDPFATRHVSTTDGHADTDKPVESEIDVAYRGMAECSTIRKRQPRRPVGVKSRPAHIG